MQDGMKGNPEEGLRRALAEFAVETGSGVASDRVLLALRREVRARAYRRWAFMSLAAAAVLAAIVFGASTRRAQPVAPTPYSSIAREGPAPGTSTAVQPSKVLEARNRPASAVAPPMAARAPRRPRPALASGGRELDAPGDWRKGEIVLSPWYYNTALPPTARSVLVRSEVDARTAMRFGVLPAGDTAPVEILFGEDGLPRAMRFVRHLPVQKN